MLGEDVEAGICGTPHRVPPAARGPGCAAAPDPARLWLLEPRSLPDAAHLLPHPAARVLPRPRRPLLTFLLCSGLGAPGTAPASPAQTQALWAGVAGGSSRRLLRAAAARRAASQRLTDYPSPSPSGGSSPQPPPPSLNHRAQGERGTERLPPPSRPGTSATRWAELRVAPPRPAPRWVEVEAHRSTEAFEGPPRLHRHLYLHSAPHTASLGGVWAPSLSCPTPTCQVRGGSEPTTCAAQQQAAEARESLCLAAIQLRSPSHTLSIRSRVKFEIVQNSRGDGKVRG